MTFGTRLNLSKPREDEESLSSLSSNDDQEQEKMIKTMEEGEGSSSEEDSDEEFEIPPGFESVKGSGAVTREAVIQNDQELWFFKLPKDLDASALANVTIKINEMHARVTRGEQLATITAGNDNKKYLLQSEDQMLTDQLVNALPLASNRARFLLGKPFSRCFSLVEDYVDASPVVGKKMKRSEEATASPVVEKRKKTSDSEKHMSKKAKHKK
ncbi:unnamed protein product [Peronospora belbahrii]|uniref:TAFII55 protein conserved region domain-containing protein n=1 Tax=Peronospora belbahrii TaxID=622444 RepID=A0AAU9KMP3_9STRA|nr:unnamed protein product [Peronospora belbahrii]